MTREEAIHIQQIELIADLQKENERLKQENESLKKQQNGTKAKQPGAKKQVN
ncbi:hypothetical protein [Parabacteroides goldsteinii]|uniref:hypothetical protein n=1 Tax=Parabacteroides goldsteinii TaxID=328812 RepID=UPI0022DFD569|nr:hypothetical protein [Parabacteroides goldsteinii]